MTPSGTFVALDTATQTEQQRAEEEKKQEMLSASRTEKVVSKESWLQQTETQNKIVKIEEENDKALANCVELATEWEKNKDSIRTKLNYVKASYFILATLKR